MPNRYAALLIGPPKSTAIKAPSTAAITTRLPPCILANSWYIQVLNRPSGALTRNTIIKPTTARLATGYSSTVLICTNADGSRLNAVRSSFTTRPAAKPAIIAPQKPEDTHSACGASEVPWMASIPPAIPATNAGKSPTDMAMNPASTTYIRLNEVLPIVRTPAWQGTFPARTFLRPHYRGPKSSLTQSIYRHR